MNCYDHKGNLVAGEVLLASLNHPEHGIFRDSENTLYIVSIKEGIARFKNGSISREKAFRIADQCIAGEQVQGGISDAMNAMAVTMLVTICEYENRINELENKLEN